MIPTPTPTPEAIVSVPVGLAFAWLVVILVGVAEVALLLVWLWRRRFATGSDLEARTREPFDVPWLASLLDRFDMGALIVDPAGQPVVWNSLAGREFALADPAAALPFSLLNQVSRVLVSETGESETTTVIDEQGQRLQVTVAPLDASARQGALILVQHPGEQTRSVESYRHLFGALAHELRSPLTAILGHADIMGSCHPQQDEVLWRRSRDFIASEADRLARLVEDLLTLSRLDLNPLQRRPVNLRAVAEEAISVLFPAAEARGVQLALQSTPGLPRVPGDRDRLYQVFLNLLDNAIKYTKGSGAVGRTAVAVHLSTAEDGVQVEVRDTGTGIAVEDLAHIFEPLYRGQDVRDISGTGLGLTIVQTILKQHGATIHVESVYDQGTTFRFCLPYD